MHNVIQAGRLTMGLLLILSCTAPAQTMGEFKSSHQAIKDRLNPRLDSVLKEFKSRFLNYSWEGVKPLFDTAHVQAQTHIYFNDRFRYQDLGEVGQRDSARVNQLYLRETLSYTQREKQALLRPPALNFAELKDLKDIRHIFFWNRKEAQAGTYIYFAMRGPFKQIYVGRFYINLNTMKILGAWI